MHTIFMLGRIDITKMVELRSTHGLFGVLYSSSYSCDRLLFVLSSRTRSYKSARTMYIYNIYVKLFKFSVYPHIIQFSFYGYISLHQSCLRWGVRRHSYIYIIQVYDYVCIYKCVALFLYTYILRTSYFYTSALE